MNNLKTFILIMVLTGLFMMIGYFIGGGSMTGAYVAMGFAFVFNFGTYWYSDKIALSMARAKEVSPQEAPQLHELVEEQARLAGMPKPRVYVIENDSPNAFATGRSPNKAAVAVTTGITRILNRRELGGVISHELAHIGNRDTLIMFSTHPPIQERVRRLKEMREAFR